MRITPFVVWCYYKNKNEVFILLKKKEKIKIMIYL